MPQNDDRKAADDSTELRESKVDWSTPYDSWLIKYLNDYRYCGAIVCRATPSAIQIQIDKVVTASNRQLLQSLLDKMPKKRVMTNMDQSPVEQLGMSMEAADGHNAVIDQCTAIIKDAIKEIEG